MNNMVTADSVAITDAFLKYCHSTRYENQKQFYEKNRDIIEAVATNSLVLSLLEFLTNNTHSMAPLKSKEDCMRFFYAIKIGKIDINKIDETILKNYSNCIIFNATYDKESDRGMAGAKLIEQCENIIISGKENEETGMDYHYFEPDSMFQYCYNFFVTNEAVGVWMFNNLAYIDSAYSFPMMVAYLLGCRKLDLGFYSHFKAKDILKAGKQYHVTQFARDKTVSKYIKHNDTYTSNNTETFKNICDNYNYLYSRGRSIENINFTMLCLPNMYFVACYENDRIHDVQLMSRFAKLYVLSCMNTMIINFELHLMFTGKKDLTPFRQQLVRSPLTAHMIRNYAEERFAPFVCNEYTSSASIGFEKYCTQLMSAGLCRNESGEVIFFLWLSHSHFSLIKPFVAYSMRYNPEQFVSILKALHINNLYESINNGKMNVLRLFDIVYFITRYSNNPDSVSPQMRPCMTKMIDDIRDYIRKIDYAYSIGQGDNFLPKILKQIIKCYEKAFENSITEVSPLHSGIVAVDRIAPSANSRDMTCYIMKART